MVEVVRGFCEIWLSFLDLWFSFGHVNTVVVVTHPVLSNTPLSPPPYPRIRWHGLHQWNWGGLEVRDAIPELNMFVLFYCPKGGVVVKQKSILLKTFFWLGFGYFPKGVRGGGVVDPNLKLLRHFLFLITRDTKGIFIGDHKT